MEKFTISVRATIETRSLAEGRREAERVIEVLADEFDSLDYCVEVVKDDTGDQPFGEAIDRRAVTYH
jgi:hypothetical protein